MGIVAQSRMKRAVCPWWLSVCVGGSVNWREYLFLSQRIFISQWYGTSYIDGSGGEREARKKEWAFSQSQKIKTNALGLWQALLLSA